MRMKDCVCVCVRVCVRERVRERERERIYMNGVLGHDSAL